MSRLDGSLTTAKKTTALPQMLRFSTVSQRAGLGFTFGSKAPPAHNTPPTDHSCHRTFQSRLGATRPIARRIQQLFNITTTGSKVIHCTLHNIISRPRTSRLNVGRIQKDSLRFLSGQETASRRMARDSRRDWRNPRSPSRFCNESCRNT